MTELKKAYTVLSPDIKSETSKNSIVLYSTTPSGAAKKVYSKVIRPFLDKNDEKKTHIVKIQNETGKVFEYKVTEMPKNDIVMRGTKPIPYSYNVHVQSLNIHRNDRSKRKRSMSPSISPVKDYQSKVIFCKPKKNTNPSETMF